MPKQSHKRQLTYSSEQDLRFIVQMLGDNGVELSLGFRASTLPEFWRLQDEVHGLRKRDSRPNYEDRYARKMEEFAECARQFGILPFTWLNYNFEYGDGMPKIIHDEINWIQLPRIQRIMLAETSPQRIADPNSRFRGVQIDNTSGPVQTAFARNVAAQLKKGYELTNLTARIGKEDRGSEYNSHWGYAASLFASDGNATVYWDDEEGSNAKEPEIITSLMALGLSL